MEKYFMGLDYKDQIVQKEVLEGSKESDGFKSMNNQQECQIQQQLHHDTKQAAPMIMNSPLFRPFFSGPPVNSQFLKGVPATSHSVIPCINFASAPAQLTIFYGGRMTTYNGISPEKAQAIMFMAGNGAFMATANAPQPSAQPTPMTPQPCSADSSTMSVSSHPLDQLTGGLANKNRDMGSLGQAMHSAIPQARKASLARFFEKRKERAMASAPYRLSKKTMEGAANSNGVVIASE